MRHGERVSSSFSFPTPPHLLFFVWMPSDKTVVTGEPRYNDWPFQATGQQTPLFSGAAQSTDGEREKDLKKSKLVQQIFFEEEGKKRSRISATEGEMDVFLIWSSKKICSVGYASRQLPKNTDLPSIRVPQKNISFDDVSTPKVCSSVPTQKIDFRQPISSPTNRFPRWQRNGACLLGTCAAPSSHERVMLFWGAFEIGRLDKGLILSFFWGGGGWGEGRRGRASSHYPSNSGRACLKRVTREWRGKNWRQRIQRSFSSIFQLICL